MRIQGEDPVFLPRPEALWGKQPCDTVASDQQPSGHVLADVCDLSPQAVVLVMTAELPDPGSYVAGYSEYILWWERGKAVHTRFGPEAPCLHSCTHSVGTAIRRCQQELGCVPH